MIDLLTKLLKRAQVSTVDKQDLYLQLLSHSDYPSLRAITDTLDYFGIDNVVANVPKEALNQLPKSFLALIENEAVNELVYIIQKEEKVVTQDTSGHRKTYSIEDFQDAWTGTIIAIEVPEKNKQSWLPKFSPLVVSGLITLLGIITSFIINAITSTNVLYTGLNLLGVVISYLIIKESLGEGNAVTAKVCGAITNDVQGCGKVINSAQSKIIRGIGLGDLSLMYFISAALTSTILGVSDSTFLVVAILSLPAIIYALYSQAFVLKQWCFLCLVIAVILISQFVVLVSTFTGWDFSLSIITNGVVLTSFVVLAWLLLKPKLDDTKKLKEVRKDFLAFKRDELVFEAILENNVIENLKEVPENAQVYYGNREAAVQLTAYTNPLCGFCKAAFEGYDKLLSQYPNDIGIQFIFNTPNDLENAGTALTKRVLELYLENPEEAFDALRYWFSNKNIDAWKKRFGENKSMLLTPSDTILETHREIIDANGINYTPETFIGNSKFSNKHYEYEDVALFIHYLKERNTTPDLVVI